MASILIYKFNKNIWNLVELKERANRSDRSPMETSRNNAENIGLKISRQNSIHEIAKQIECDFDAKHFLGIAIRYTLLCTIPITFNNLQFSGWILLQFDVIKNEDSIIWFAIFWDWIFNLVLFTNFFCIWLSFPFAKHLYYKKYICGYYHNKCERCCHYVVGFRILAEDHRQQCLQLQATESNINANVDL